MITSHQSFIIYSSTHQNNFDEVLMTANTTIIQLLTSISSIHQKN